MKILIAGDWHSNLHEQPLLEAFEVLGHTCYAFKWCNYLSSPAARIASRVSYFTLSRFRRYPFYRTLNQSLYLMALDVKPDILFLYRANVIFPSTLLAIKESLSSIKIVSYNNDNPFSPSYSSGYWQLFKAIQPHVNLACGYRPSDLPSLSALGAPKTHLLPPWFIPSRIPLDCRLEPVRSPERFLGFVGHCEDDGRVSVLEMLHLLGFQPHIVGPIDGFGKFGWRPSINLSPIIQAIRPLDYLPHHHYMSFLSQTQISLCFLSKHNQDVYTRRCFEIPAVGSALFSEYTPDLANLFTEGVHAEFFRSPSELVHKLLYYKANPHKLLLLRQQGYHYIHSAGHDIISRAKSIFQALL